MAKTPELNKMSAVHKKSQVIGEFLSWLESDKNWFLCAEHKHTEHCYRPHDHKNDACGLMRNKCVRTREKVCSLNEGDFEPVHYGSAETLLAEFFGIDLDKAEKERRALLAELQKAQAKPRKAGH